MAVFPDRIVLKNSTDQEAAIRTAIETDGTDAITQGEVVLGLSDGAATLFTKDSAGAIVTISGSDDIESLNDISDVQYATSQSFTGLSNSTGDLESNSIQNSGDWTVPASNSILYFHKDQAEQMARLLLGYNVIFQAYGLTHSTSITAVATESQADNTRWSIEVSPAFPGSSWVEPDMPAGQALTITNSSWSAIPVNPADGEVLTWVGANSQWEPAVGGGGGSGGLVFWGGGDFTTGVSDGEVPDGGEFT